MFHCPTCNDTVGFSTSYEVIKRMHVVVQNNDQGILRGAIDTITLPNDFGYCFKCQERVVPILKSKYNKYT